MVKAIISLSSISTIVATHNLQDNHAQISEPTSPNSSSSGASSSGSGPASPKNSGRSFLAGKINEATQKRAKETRGLVPGKLWDEEKDIENWKDEENLPEKMKTRYLEKLSIQDLESLKENLEKTIVGWPAEAKNNAERKVEEISDIIFEKKKSAEEPRAEIDKAPKEPETKKRVKAAKAVANPAAKLDNGKITVKEMLLTGFQAAGI